ncbi:CheY-like chemotaxis protein [Krasilnikovia cinnamomea]|uniref:CheY-like chemotaxis protein n=1 Tax=Krasilnikovia cinnamomea TaxID=349313 RepID=A0A4Q7ZEU8_9ACTN|nr:response regulator [Krasilnikovia cinnamomea]RZU48791.1 CheY-like chemotaxis protein [Krasilnikovia cinnamomea]
MTNPRGLIVDDFPGLAEQIKGIVDYGFNALNWEVECEPTDSILTAFRMIQELPTFDFAIIDYDLDGEIGKSVVEELRMRQGPDCYVLVITGEASRHPDFRELSIGAGADDAIIRTRLTLRPRGNDGSEAWDAVSLARRIRKHMKALERVHDFKIEFAKDTGTQSMLSSLGEPPGARGDVIDRGKHIARTLILEFLERENDAGAVLFVDRLAPGRSGAHVCKVRRKQAGQPEESFVLKIGLDRAALEAERQANDEAARVLTSQLLVTHTDGLKTDHSSDYGALAARLAHNAVTLDSWLRSPETTAAQARQVADELFGGHLKRLFQETLRQTQDSSRWLDTAPLHKRRIEDALATYAPVWAHPEGAHQENVDERVVLLRTYIETRTLPGVEPSMIDKTVVFVHAFGDLHATNVLVQTVGQPRPVLVDASQYGPHHWATDSTRLLVDLVLQVRRAGVESMLWSAVADDCAYADGLCGCTADNAGESTTPVDAFIAQVLTEQRRYLCVAELGLRDAFWHWQWHVALAREFLRQGTRTGMLPTRAVVALSAAASHLRRAADALRS